MTSAVCRNCSADFNQTYPNVSPNGLVRVCDIIYYSDCVSKIGVYIPTRDLNFIFIEAIAEMNMKFRSRDGIYTPIFDTQSE